MEIFSKAVSKKTKFDLFTSACFRCFWGLTAVKNLIIFLHFYVVYGIKIIAGYPCGVRGDDDLKEPMPLLREVRPCRVGKARLTGLSNASNGCPLGIRGFFPKVVFTT